MGIRKSIPKWMKDVIISASPGNPSSCQRAMVSGQNPIVSHLNGLSTGSNRHVARNRSLAFTLCCLGLLPLLVEVMLQFLQAALDLLNDISLLFDQVTVETEKQILRH
jgi:hypothetical protein